MTLKVSLPIAGTRAIAIANALISTMILARADHKALAINAFITTSQLLICGSILSMFTPVSILISKASGQHKEDGIANYMRSSFLLSFFIALIIIFFCKCIGPILRVFKQPVELICLLEEYFDLFTWTVPALVLSQVFTQFYYGTLRTKCIFVINVVSTIIFALVSYILVLSKWASSDMFIQGLGFACIIKFWFNLIALTIYIYSTEMRTYLKKCYTSFSVSFDALKEICCLGWPVILQVGAETLNSLVYIMFAGWISISALIITQITNQIYLTFSIPLYAASQASSILIGRAIGGKDHQQISSIVKSSIWIGIIFIFLFLSMLFVKTNLILNFLVGDDLVLNASNIELLITLFIVGLCLVLDVFISSLNGALRGILDFKVPIMVSFLCHWLIAIPLSYIYAVHFGYGPIALFIFKSISQGLIILILWCRWDLKCKLAFIS